MLMMFAIFIWGFSEATLFFIIPDVLLSLYAIRTKSINRVIIANVVCVLGAMIGGTLMYVLSVSGVELIDVLMTLPAIHPHMIEHVHAELASNVFTALITGPLFGVPYKIFAVIASEYTTLLMFLLLSIPARLTRFLLISMISYILSHYVFNRLDIRTKYIIWFVVWFIGYSAYFIAVGL